MAGIANALALTADESTDESPLNDQQMRFVDYYVTTMNQTQAYELAGYTGEEHTLAIGASRLMRNAKVTREINKRLQNFTMTSNEILVRLTDIARADIGDSVNDNGDIDIKQLKRAGKSHLIKKVKKRTYTTMDQDGNDKVVSEVEVELHDSLDALKVLAKFHGLVMERLKVEDWRSQAIEEIRQGKLAYNAVAQAFDVQIAKELFLSAGVPIVRDEDIVDGQYTEQTESPIAVGQAGSPEPKPVHTVDSVPAQAATSTHVPTEQVSDTLSE